MQPSFEFEYLSERLAELENATDHLVFIIENEDGVYFQSDFMKSNLTKVLTESAAVRRRLAELKHES